MQPTRMRGRVLIIAGSDSGGGAGIQADIKTVTALGGYAATAVTAVTVQNTEGVIGIHVVPTQTVVAQINAVLADIGADVIKTGMLASGELIDTVYSVLRRTAPDTPLVVDPVMVAKGGAALIDKDAVHAMKGRLIPRATVITPNLPEAETLLGRKIGDVQAMREAVEALRDLGPRGVLLKGGHLPGDDLVDIYTGPEGTQEWSARRSRRCAIWARAGSCSRAGTCRATISSTSTPAPKARRSGTRSASTRPTRTAPAARLRRRSQRDWLKASA